MNNEIEELKIVLNSRYGGKTTCRILEQLFDGPKNANNMARTLHIDYKTVIYHLNIIKSHDYVKLMKLNGITFYTVSDKLKNNEQEYYKILSKQKFE